MINFDVMPYKYWSDQTKISLLQRRVLVYSIQYYNLSETVISDKEYDSISRQLLQLQKIASKEDREGSQYWYVFHDFDANTGFDLYSRLTKKDQIYLTKIAAFVLSNYQRKGASKSGIKRFSKSKV